MTIDLDAVEHNFASMKKRINEKTKMIAVIKADGYGHGAVQIGRLMEPKDFIWGFAAATAEEALELKRAGLTKPILILGYVFPDSWEELIKREIRIPVFDLETAGALNTLAHKLQKKAYIHLALDTGMSRIGFRDEEASIEEIRQITDLGMVEIEGLFTHFARADEADKAYADRQLHRYQEFSDRLEAAGVKIPLHHCSNSAGILEMPYANLDLVRAGITIYGIYPSDEMKREKDLLRPVMEWKSRVSYVKDIQAGTQVSYGGTFTAQKDMRIATIPVGYADGYPRLLSNRGCVLIRGKRAKIIGRVCMDQFLVDVTEIPDVCRADQVTLLGKDGSECITVEELSAECGRFPYEFVCDVSKRVPRVYLKDGMIREQKDYF